MPSSFSHLSAMSSLQEVHSEQAAAARKCPFSDKTGFKSIGCHLPHCQKRNGRDYSMYLSAKTLSKKTAASHKFCPKCHKRFTHLRTSATCKNIPSVPPIPAVTQTNYPQGSSNSDPSAISKPDPAISNFTPLDYHHKPRVKLPPTQEEWEDANSYFSRVLVPQVLCETSPDSKNSRLSDGIYDFLANKYGTRQHSKRRRRQEKHALALNKARKLKNEARRELRRARVNSTLSAEEIRSLARKFYQLVRSHSRRPTNRQQVPGGLGRLEMSATKLSGHLQNNYLMSHPRRILSLNSQRKRPYSISLRPTVLNQSPLLPQTGCHLLHPLLLSSTVRRSL